MAAACSPVVSPTPVPTSTLIPATVTDTPTPVPPTSTPVGSDLSRPSDVASATPSDDANSEIVAIPAVAQPLIEAALNDLAEKLNVDADTIQMVRLESALWQGDNLGCDLTVIETESTPESTAEATVEATIEAAAEVTPEATIEPTATVVVEQIEGFRLVLVADGQRYEYHTDTRSEIMPCNQGSVSGDTAGDTLLTVDPIAAELVVLARRRLADELDLPIQRIRLVDVTSARWEDSSLGCPLPDQNYTTLQIDGYRIVLGAGSEDYIFHSDSERLTPCAAEFERLPASMLAESTPEATAEATETV